MWSRELAEDRTEHQKGDLKEASLLVPEGLFEYFRNAQPSLLTENGLEKQNKSSEWQFGLKYIIDVRGQRNMGEKVLR